MIYQREIQLHTTSHGQMHDLTSEVARIVAESGMRCGFVNIFHVGSTGAIGTGAADMEDVHEAAAHARLSHDAGDLAREVVHLAVAGGMELNLSLVNHARFLPRTGSTGQPSLN